MRLTVKQPLPFWADLLANPFSGDQTGGTTVTLTEDSQFITRITGATFAESYVVEWTILHPKDGEDYTAVYVSSDEGIATVNAIGVLTVVSNGVVFITVTVTRSSDGVSMEDSIPASVSIDSGLSIDYVENAPATAGAAFDSAIGSLLSGKTPSTAKPRFDSRDIGTKTFTRNDSFWGIGLDGLSALSPNNSRGANNRAGTALTKRHVICAAHYPLAKGDTIDFVTDVSGATVASTHTIQEAKTHPLYAGQSGGYCYDIQICLLDSDLPAGIDFMEVMPSNYGDYIGQYGWMGGVGCVFDQEQKGLSTLSARLPTGYYYGQELPEHWFTNIRTASMLTGFNYDPIAFGYDSPSDFVSPRLMLPSDDVFLFSENIISGDSGGANCFILGSKLLLVGLNTTPDGGTYLANRIPDMNQLILDVDALAGISTGYTVTEADLSSYPTY
tara:strand:+ start:871 stop:2199 length:1329 start_codon:yes stop_codon:yes gene_type:complete